MVADFNKDGDSTLIRFRIKMLKDGLHGAGNSSPGLKKHLGMLFRHREFERHALNKELVAFFYVTALNHMFDVSVQVQDETKLEIYKAEVRSYFNGNYIKAELLAVPAEYPADSQPVP